MDNVFGDVLTVDKGAVGEKPFNGADGEFLIGVEM